jgi:hypothetical protein
MNEKVHVFIPIGGSERFYNAHSSEMGNYLFSTVEVEIDIVLDPYNKKNVPDAHERKDDGTNNNSTLGKANVPQTGCKFNMHVYPNVDKPNVETILTEVETLLWEIKVPYLLLKEKMFVYVLTENAKAQGHPPTRLECIQMLKKNDTLIIQEFAHPTDRLLETTTLEAFNSTVRSGGAEVMHASPVKSDLIHETA